MWRLSSYIAKLKATLTSCRSFLAMPQHRCDASGCCHKLACEACFLSLEPIRSLFQLSRVIVEHAMCCRVVCGSGHAYTHYVSYRNEYAQLLQICGEPSSIAVPVSSALPFHLGLRGLQPLYGQTRTSVSLCQLLMLYIIYSMLEHLTDTAPHRYCTDQ